MMLADKIFSELGQRDGLSDRQLSEAIFGNRHRSTQVNGECHYLENRGLIVRKKQVDEPIRNYLPRSKPHLELVRAGHNLRGELMNSCNIQITCGLRRDPLDCPSPTRHH